MNYKRIALALLVGLAGVSGLVLAWNMGFMLNKTLLGPGPLSVDGTNTISLPYIREIGVDTASQLVASIGGFAPGPVVNVQRFNPANNSQTIYSGGRTLNFPLVAGACYRVRVSVTVPYLIMGSHDPGLIVTLAGPGLGSVDGTNQYAPPWHSTATTAAQLVAELGGFAPGPVVNVQRFNPANNSTTIYSGGRTLNFPLDLDGCYRGISTATGPTRSAVSSSLRSRSSSCAYPRERNTAAPAARVDACRRDNHPWPKRPARGVRSGGSAFLLRSRRVDVRDRPPRRPRREADPRKRGVRGVVCERVRLSFARSVT